MGATFRVRRILSAAPFFVWILSFVLISCASDQGGRAAASEDIKIRGFVESFPFDSRPVFIGLSPRLQDRSAEEAAAVADAAVKAARYGELTGTVVYAAKRQGSFSSVVVEYRIEDDPDSVAEIAAAIKLQESLVTATGTVVRCIFPDTSPLTVLPFAPRDAYLRPIWLEKIPENPGYLTAVGSAGRSRLIAESFSKADDSALAGILSQTSLLINSDSNTRTISGTGTITQQENRQIAQGSLRGYYILDRWISDDGRTFHALAVCPLDM